MADDERHVGDELEDSGSKMENAADSAIDTARQGKDLYDRVNDNKDNKGNKNASSAKNNKGANDKGASDKGSQADKSSSASKDGSRMGGKLSDGGGKAGQGAKSGANAGAEAAKDAGQEAATNAVKQGSEKGAEAATTASTNAAGTAAGTAAAPGIGTAVGAALDAALNLIKKTAKYVVSWTCIMIAFGVIFIAMFPTLMLRALLQEILMKIATGVTELAYVYLDFDGWDEMSEEEKRAVVRSAAEKFVGRVEDFTADRLSSVFEDAATFFQFFDDITDDDTWYGGVFNDASNFFYGKHIEIEIDQIQKDQKLDSTTLMTTMVITQLRACYTNTVSLDLNQMLGAEKEKAQKLKDIYCKMDPAYESNFTLDASSLIYYLDPALGCSLQDTYIPTHNNPIIIEDPDYYVYLNGKDTPEGMIDDNGVQHLRDSIIYNPYGNKRSSLSLSTGSDYEMMCHAAYIIAVYSACTPYAKQTLADLLTKMRDGMEEAGKNGRNLIKYSTEFTSVYFGAIVPRLYQPYLYIPKNNQDGTIPWRTGTPVEGYYDKGNGTPREVMYMTPLTGAEAENYTLFDAYGWVDVDGKMDYNSDTETFRICMQPLSSETSDISPFYPNSFCVITGQKNKTDMSYDPEKNNAKVNAIESNLGYYIEGTDTEDGRYSGLGYATMDWESDFNAQLQEQQIIESWIDESKRADYIYRYEFPFTRISCLGEDETFEYVRSVPILGPNTSEDYIIKMMVGTKDDGTPRYFNSNDGKDDTINGYLTWAYVGRNIDFAITDADYKSEDAQVRKDLKFFDISLDNWGEDIVWKENHVSLEADHPQYDCNPWLYTAKMRYMISVNTTAIAQYFDFVNECFGYQPSEVVRREMTYGENGEEIVSTVTQVDMATETLKAYMLLLGVKEEVIVASNPNIGTEPTYSYEQVLEIVRQAKNADGTPTTLSRKYACFVGLCAAGHVMYEWAGDQEAGLNFQAWTVQKSQGGSEPGNYSDSTYGDNQYWRENYGYEYKGMDCSGFVSWIIKTAYNPNFSRFDTSSVIDISPFAGSSLKTTEAVIQGKASATSSYGNVFTDDSQLKVGDWGVKRKYDSATKTYSGHIAMFVGIDETTGHQRWIEMTRYGFKNNGTNPTSGVRLFTTTSYKINSNAVYIHPSSSIIPDEDVTWTVISPAYMLIPSKDEVS